MMIAYQIPASIQGEILSLRGRRFYSYPPKKDNALNFIIYTFKLQDSAVATIEKELSPKTPFHNNNKNSMLDQGNRIRGEIIGGFTDKPIGAPKVLPGTSAHRTQAIKTPRGMNFAELIRMYRALQLKISQ